MILNHDQTDTRTIETYGLEVPQEQLDDLRTAPPVSGARTRFLALAGPKGSRNHKIGPNTGAQPTTDTGGRPTK